MNRWMQWSVRPQRELKAPSQSLLQQLYLGLTVDLILREKERGGERRRRRRPKRERRRGRKCWARVEVNMETSTSWFPCVYGSKKPRIKKGCGKGKENWVVLWLLPFILYLHTSLLLSKTLSWRVPLQNPFQHGSHLLWSPGVKQKSWIISPIQYPLPDLLPRLL